MSTRTLESGEVGGLHPIVAQVVRRLEQNVEGLTPWDVVTVEDRPHTAGRRTGTWYTIRAERHPGTLASTTVQVFVRSSGPHRGRFLGGDVFVTLGTDRKIKTWADLRRAW